MEIVDLRSLVDGDMLLEESFKTKVSEVDWSQYAGKKTLIRGCSDIIIPTWAYMMVSAKLAEHATVIRYGNEHSNLVIYRKSKVANPVNKKD